MNTQIKILVISLYLLYGLYGSSQETKKYFFNRGNIAKLTANVIDGKTSEQDKVIAIHDWITHNIKWKDVKPIESKRKIIKKVLRKRKGTAISFVVLFDEMCQFAQVETNIVRGNTASQFSSNYDPRALEITKHTWSAVKINGDWQLIDIMFDAGSFKPKKYKFRKFIEKNIIIPIPGNPKRFYFIKKKSKWVKEPSHTFFMQNDRMLSTHFPLMPMWQLTEDTISVEMYRKKPWEIRAHKAASSNYELDFNAKIDNFTFATHPEYLEGNNGNKHNDTNFVSLSNGEVHFVDKSIDLQKQYPVYSVVELEERLVQIDSLFMILKLSKEHSKSALQIEKKVYSSNNKVHKARNKEVISQNDKKVSKHSKTIEKTIQISDQLKAENKRIFEKEVSYEKKLDKYGKWSPSYKDTKPVSAKEHKKRSKIVTDYLSSISTITKKMDSLENEFKQQLKTSFTALKKQIVDTLMQETSKTSACKFLVEEYNHNLDSTYFSNRKIANRLYNSHVLLSDSLIKKFIRLQKKTLSRYKKELSKINTAKKEIYANLKVIYSNGDISSYSDELEEINVIYIERFSTLRDFKLQITERNEDFIAWFKSYRKRLKGAIKEYTFESGKENLRLKTDLQYENKLYNKQAERIQNIQKAGKEAKTKLKTAQKETKVLLKEAGKFD